jgi:acyl carrier protein
MQSDVEGRLRKFVGEWFLSQEEPWPGSGDSSLRDCGIILHDTELLELIDFLEKTFAIAVLDHEIRPENLDTIHALATYVDRKLALALADVAQALANAASGKSSGGLRGLRTELAALTASALSSVS